MNNERISSAALRHGITSTLYVVAYVALDWVSYIHPFAQLAITPWNPPPGLSLFLLLRYGLRYVPALFVASLLAELLVRGVPMHPLLSIGSSVLLASAYALLGVALAGPLHVGRNLDNVRDMNRFVTAALGGPLLIALAYVGLHASVGALSVADSGKATIQFWIGDAIGIVVTTPLLLQLANRGAMATRRVDAALVLQSATVLLALWIVFGLRATDEYKFFYLLFLPLIWIAISRGLPGAVMASFAIQLGLIAAEDRLTAKGIELWEIQFLMLTLAVTALYLGTVVSERRVAQRALMARDAALNRALRMATAGEVAAAVAHEINQPLSAIGSYVDACAAMLDKPSALPLLRSTLANVSQEVARAGEVIRRLREFFTTGTTRRERVMPRALLQGAAESVAPRLAQVGIVLELTCSPDLPLVDVDRIQVHAVLHNLLVNAIDALADSRDADRRIVVGAAPGAPGMLALTIADTGPGVAPEAAARLFEAFNTTKPTGMGLGLAISRSIVEAHGGRLGLTRTALPGAAFELTLPIAGAEATSHG